MEIHASVKNVRLSPEKVRLLVDEIKKMSPMQAVKTLNFINKSSSPVLKKVIASAIANAKNNHGIADVDLFFKEILVGKGPVAKRYQPVSRGRAHHILKRTTNIKVILGTKEKEEMPKKAEKKVIENQKPDKKIRMTKSKGGENGTKS